MYREKSLWDIGRCNCWPKILKVSGFKTKPHNPSTFPIKYFPIAYVKLRRTINPGCLTRNS